MITIVLREIAIALAFFAIPLWAFGIIGKHLLPEQRW
jgi:hypothetical protein